MKHQTRLTVAAVLSATLFLTSPIMAAGGGGSSTTTEDNSLNMTYVTIGLALLVGGYLVYDAIKDAGNDNEEDISYLEVVDTGIEWEEAFPLQHGQTAIAVSIFSGENGQRDALQFIEILSELSEGNLQVYEDPVDLGRGSYVARAALAKEFFNSDYLIFRELQNDSVPLYGMASPDSVLWTWEDDAGSSIIVVVTELLESEALR